MISEKETTRLSKQLSYVLRHNPGDIGITLDEQGWADVAILLNSLTANGHPITLDVLRHVVATNAKQRFSFNSDETKIRANQGHSVEVELGYTATTPPEFLYHGTVDRFAAAIMQQGLQKMNRHHVHLSADTATATTVGLRRGKPLILQVSAGKMYEAGYRFYLSDNNVWLTDEVPPAFIQLFRKRCCV